MHVCGSGLTNPKSSSSQAGQAEAAPACCCTCCQRDMTVPMRCLVGFGWCSHVMGVWYAQDCSCAGLPPKLPVGCACAPALLKALTIGAQSLVQTL